MDDKTLLELAARAYDDKNIIKGLYPTFQRYIGGGVFVEWNPLTDDGDALRLAVKLGPEFYFGNSEGPASSYCGYTEAGRIRYIIEPIGDDPNAAARRAIVRAAAAIAEQGEKE